MKYEIKPVFGHWELYVNGQFKGSYDTFMEAAKDVDKMKEEEKGSAA